MGKSPVEEQKGKARNGTGKRYSEGFLGFVDVQLSDTDKAALAQMVENGEFSVSDFLMALSEEGYKFSLSPDPEHNSVIATATGKGAANPNKGYALSARGPSPSSAILVLWYKVAHLTEWGAWVGSSASDWQQLDMFR